MEYAVLHTLWLSTLAVLSQHASRYQYTRFIVSQSTKMQTVSLITSIPKYPSKEASKSGTLAVFLGCNFLFSTATASVFYLYACHRLFTVLVLTLTPFCMNYPGRGITVEHTRICSQNRAQDRLKPLENQLPHK